jgi:hypothetical protein
MHDNALAALEPDAQTVKRAHWEGFEFDFDAPGTVRVMNGLYGDDERADHSYRVTVENGFAVACECKADEYRDGACKHRVAVAIRDLVLEAAHDTDFGTNAPDSTRQNPAPVTTDGGQLVEAETKAKAATNHEPTITGPHMEPAEISNATTFWRCEDCGRESIREQDVYRPAFHAEGCAGSEGLDSWPEASRRTRGVFVPVTPLR